MIDPQPSRPRQSPSLRYHGSDVGPRVHSCRCSVLRRLRHNAVMHIEIYERAKKQEALQSQADDKDFERTKPLGSSRATTFHKVSHTTTRTSEENKSQPTSKSLKSELHSHPCSPVEMKNYIGKFASLCQAVRCNKSFKTAPDKSAGTSSATGIEIHGDGPSIKRRFIDIGPSGDNNDPKPVTILNNDLSSSDESDDDTDVFNQELEYTEEETTSQESCRSEILLSIMDLTLHHPSDHTIDGFRDEEEPEPHPDDYIAYALKHPEYFRHLRETFDKHESG
jgi:hypothetical protein